MKFATQIIASVVIVFAFVYLFGNGVNGVRQIFLYSARPPVESEQLARRGTGLFQITNPRETERLRELNAIPASVPYPAGLEGEEAGDVYENVQVLRDVSTGAFTRLMVNITEWVAPEEGCAACHDVADFADDSLYTKVVARRMLQMTREINGEWTDHVANTGVTCYTCHRGNLVPPNIWFRKPGPGKAIGMLASVVEPQGAKPARSTTGGRRDPFASFLEGDLDIRVTPRTSRGDDHSTGVKEATATHGLMLHISQSLGVNCGYCHNTRAFDDWSQSSLKRTTAWYGIRMVRDLNNKYLNPLAEVFPPHRLGPAMGDSPKVNCATCHNGVFKPLFGEAMVDAFPSLKGVPVEEAPLLSQTFR